jgi:hypothetical protein
LARSGIDERHLRQTLREDLRIRAYEEQRFTTPPATDDELATYYRANAAAFTRDGRVMPFDQVRADVVRVLARDRRATAIADWIAGLRRRAEVIDLYLPGR